MRAYAISLLAALGVLLTGFAGFILVVDPYDVVGWVAIDGVNARKTRTHEDGGRVTRSHPLLTTTARAAVIGNSRVVDGFPGRVEEWPGGLVNAGFRGANAFELARAVVLAADNPHLDCLVIGLDLDDFGAHAKAQATYWITPLSDRARPLAIGRMALSPHAFARALQTLEDNRTGGSDEVMFHDRYAPGWQHERFENSVPGALGHYRSYRFDPERVDFLLQAIEGANAAGLQVLMFFHPMHAYRQEALYAAGLGPRRDSLLATLAQAADRLSARPAHAPCAPGPSVQLWDFGGYQTVTVAAPPGPRQELSHPYYHEPPHYRAAVGRAVLDRMRGAAREAPFDKEQFGARVTPAAAAAIAAAAQRRRAVWREGDAHGRQVVARIADMLTAPPPGPGQLTYLTRDDRAGMTRDVRRLLGRDPPAPSASRAARQ